MHSGFGFELTLRQVPRLEQRMQQLCRVCRQEHTVEGHRLGQALERDSQPFDVCVCCGQPVPDPKDRAYRARARRWRARYAG